MTSFSKKLKYYLFPQHTEVSLFLMIITFFLLLVIDPIAFGAFYDFYFDELAILMLFMVLGGMGIVHFALNTKSGPTQNGKFFMMLFIVFLQFFLSSMLFDYYSIKLADEIISESITLYTFPWISLVLAIYNFIYGFFLIIGIRLNYIDENTISSYNASHTELKWGSFAIVFLFFLLRYIFKFDWQITLSLLVTYSLVINHIILEYFVVDQTQLKKIKKHHRGGLKK